MEKNGVKRSGKEIFGRVRFLLRVSPEFKCFVQAFLQSDNSSLKKEGLLCGFWNNILIFAL